MENNDWEKLDEMCRSAIRLSLSKSIYYNVKDAEGGAYELWQWICDMYDKHSATSMVYWIKKLIDLRMEEGASMNTHLIEFNTIFSQLAMQKITFQDNVVSLLVQWLLEAGLWTSISPTRVNLEANPVQVQVKRLWNVFIVVEKAIIKRIATSGKGKMGMIFGSGLVSSVTGLCFSSADLVHYSESSVSIYCSILDWLADLYSGLVSFLVLVSGSKLATGLVQQFSSVLDWEKNLDELEWLIRLLTTSDPYPVKDMHPIAQIYPLAQVDYTRLVRFLVLLCEEDDEDIEDDWTDMSHGMIDNDFIYLDDEDRGLALGLPPNLFNILFP
ncbi:hypothetical protein L7F22_002660 [Adiantum nelumboides]|nr:hypothetical protein [Adiantum nelumboides]